MPPHLVANMVTNRNAYTIYLSYYIAYKPLGAGKRTGRRKVSGEYKEKWYENSIA